jgi:antitoxin component YwqK of YwqJK toxin-antitoxin module
MRALCLLLLVMACRQPPSSPVLLPPQVYVGAGDPGLKQVNGSWFRNAKPFSGWITESQDSIITAMLPVINGLANGVALAWYPDGSRSSESGFEKGKREGFHRGWYANGQRSYEYYFHNDLYEGVQQSWYANGAAWQMNHYEKGNETGRQKGWNESGRLVNNYTVRNGRLYGVIGRFDCMAVHR